MGTPEEAVPSLVAVQAAGHEVALVITPPDAPAGRGCEPRPPRVKQAAQMLGLPVAQPESVRQAQTIETVRGLCPDALVVVAFGQILPRALLEVPRWGGINVHFSLLPQWRGAAPVEHALLSGATTTGVSVMRMSGRMDAGPVLASASWRVREGDDRASLKQRLAHLGADLLVGVLWRLTHGGVGRVHQDHSKATYAPKITDESARLDWRRPARALADAVKAFSPFPGAWTEIRARRVKLYCARVLNVSSPLPEPGTVIAVLADGLVVAAGDGAVLLREAQQEGRKRVPARALANGLRLKVGDRLGV